MLPEQKVSLGFGPRTVDVICVAIGSAGRQSLLEERLNGQYTWEYAWIEVFSD